MIGQRCGRANDLSTYHPETSKTMKTKKSFKNRNLAFYFLLAINPLSATANATLCNKDEVIYFSCNIKNSKKLVSLCGTPFFDATTYKKLESPSIQYRFGQQGRVELAYPTKKPNPREIFVGEYHHPHNGFSHALSFTRNNVLYSLEIIEADTRFYGVRITEESKTIKLSCQNFPIIQYDNDINSFYLLVSTLDPYSQ